MKPRPASRTLLQLRLRGVSLEYSGDGSSLGAVLDAGMRGMLGPCLGAESSLLESLDASSAAALDTTSTEALSDAILETAGGHGSLSRGRFDRADRLGPVTEAAAAVARDFEAPTAVQGASNRLCRWCRGELPATEHDDDGRRDARVWCSKRCRQAAWRQRMLSRMEGADGAPKRIGYADPPYPGTARKYYRDEPTYAGEVDHVELIAKLQTFDGWALSTSAKALRALLPLCPENARVCVWVKPHGVSSKTRGLHNAWEPIIVVPARTVRPGVPDFLSTLPARRGGSLPGRKPQKFCARLFQWLGMRPGDELDDLFPGTGIITRAWRETERAALAKAGAR